MGTHSARLQPKREVLMKYTRLPWKLCSAALKLPVKPRYLKIAPLNPAGSLINIQLASEDGLTRKIQRTKNLDLALALAPV